MKRNIQLRKNLFCSFLSFCCDQKERNAVKAKSVGLSCRLGAAKVFYVRGLVFRADEDTRRVLSALPNDNGLRNDESGAGKILASDAGVSRTYEDTLRVRPTGSE